VWHSPVLCQLQYWTPYWPHCTKGRFIFFKNVFTWSEIFSSPKYIHKWFSDLSTKNHGLDSKGSDFWEDRRDLDRVKYVKLLKKKLASVFQVNSSFTNCLNLSQLLKSSLSIGLLLFLTFFLLWSATLFRGFFVQWKLFSQHKENLEVYRDSFFKLITHFVQIKQSTGHLLFFFLFFFSFFTFLKSSCYSWHCSAEKIKRNVFRFDSVGKKTTVYVPNQKEKQDELKYSWKIIINISFIYFRC